ncbi:MAG TPA: type II toxin-antitoxin system HicA family toxin [Candidatus Acidoferrales bacterium]|nr:type II toxin-antitoxin system HicA family toxin [Candidatus Acidoferrales bacterium]
MSRWPSTKASKVFRALLRNGYTVKSQRGSHVVLTHPVRGDYVWAFHDAVEIGPKMLARIAKHTGLRPEDL